MMHRGQHCLLSGLMCNLCSWLYWSWLLERIKTMHFHTNLAMAVFLNHCMNTFKIPTILVVTLALWCSAISESYADTPSIQRVSPDTQSGWQVFASEFREGVLAKPVQLQAVSKLRSFDRVEPIMLAVVLQPGDPIEKYGASMFEFLFVELIGKNVSGQTERCLAVLTRSPYEDRKWNILDVSGVNATPPLLPILQLPSGGDAKKSVLNYVKKVFEPGICMGTRESVVNVVIYDSDLTALIGDKITDIELRALFARASK